MPYMIRSIVSSLLMRACEEVVVAVGIALKVEAAQKAEEVYGLIGLVVMNSFQSDLPRLRGRLLCLQQCNFRLKHINSITKRVYCFPYKLLAANSTLKGAFAHQERSTVCERRTSVQPWCINQATGTLAVYSMLPATLSLASTVGLS